MKKTEKAVCVIAALLLSCATEPDLAFDLPPSEAGTPSELAPMERSPLPTGEEMEVRIAERMAVAAAEARAITDAMPTVHATSQTTRTAVQQADGTYPECFSELPAHRRECRSHFGRLWSESTIMRRQGDDAAQRDATKLVLGRIILSEANWPHDERRDRYFPEQNHAEIDAPAIYQVLRHTRRNGETLLGAMRRHAPHVSEARPISGRLLGRRMFWVSRLQLDCDEPSGFPQLDQEGNPMNWERDYRPRCESLFALAQRLLDGDAEVLGPWTSAPLVTWGGRCEDAAGACDDHLASHRGLVPFDTGDTANRFWCRPGVAGCDGPPLEIATAE